jgi:MIP family channel proteins
MTLFVFFGCGAASSNAHFTPAAPPAWDGTTAGGAEWDSASVTIIALQFGLGITVLAYATAHTSGGHINCAVTLALTIVGSCHPVRAVAYVISQLLGSIVGAALLLATTGGDIADGGIDRTGGLGSNGRQNPNVTVGNAVLAEIMGTALLCFVVLESAVNVNAVTTEGESMIRGNKQNLAPIPIGLAVFLAHVICIPITGCSINPTRSFGPAVVSDTWTDHWIWWVGPCTGAVLASLIWGILKFLDEPKATDTTATATPSSSSAAV